jgi:hypothetical protein
MNEKRKNLTYPSHPDEVRLKEHLKLACERMGALSVEEALWIFIPIDRSGRVTWRLAVGQEGGISPLIRLPVSVAYTPTPKEVARILETGRQSEWIVHVHNHPLEPFPGTVGSLSPSKNDLRFAGSWKVRLPAVADRMRFFIVQGDRHLEY